VTAPAAGFSAMEDPGPFAEHVGPFYVRDDDERPALGLHAGPEHANRAGVVHGGLLATLCDLAIGHAVRTRADEISGAATVSLTTDYLAPATPGAWLEARVEIEKLGRRLAFADCSVTADGHEVVRARAVFSVLD
jgi:acyl-coenzyme A thioesterase 13